MQPDDMPLVSIVIPVYNGANFLREAVDSALAQTYNNIEILVINDGSNDNGATERIAKSYGDRIRYYYKDNGGVSSALNMGIQKSRGEYFCWLSHDDIYYPHKVETMLRAVLASGDRTTPGYSNYDELDMETGETFHRRFEQYIARDKLTQGLYPAILAMGNAITWIIHTSHFKRVGLFNEELLVVQDNDMRFRLFRGQRVVFVEEATACVRKHPEQGTRTLTPMRMDEVTKVLERQLCAVTESEAVGLFGGMWYFYEIMLSYFQRRNLPTLEERMLRQLRSLSVPQEISLKTREVRDLLKHSGKGRTNALCIFGAGAYGKLVRRRLGLININVDCFSDNNPNKWANEIDGIPCKNPTDINYDRTLVIVAMKNPCPVMSQLNNAGAPYTVTAQETGLLSISISPDW